MQAAVRTDVGKVRAINEDYIFVSDPYPNGLLVAIVADGMGGHQAGEIASKTAVEVIYHEIHQIMSNNLSIEGYQLALEKAIHKANGEVYKQSLNNDGYRGMGTTILASIISPEWIILGHIGDSRAYLVDDNNIRQLTEDHSLVNELVKEGQLTQEEAMTHPKKNILTRALGTEEKVKVDICLIHWEKDQTLLLCSDGLTNHVSDEKIFEVLNQKDVSIENKTDYLLSLAIDAGGEDNISIILVCH
ncbi:Stp1/IreP family PP2C-type Ser/Thr phosphatase [Vulcanibacillus modesticaldus]|uniref:Stp1/IreP family PP2C-type Ser/Thr phosphatase n=1 Tax=Vulcanibacillus modesticaldus TaxID=337097 RepID=UPI000AA12579|nr:Stp1/IreP family PP2C-type Ser/Thr phosphatase [Vulcanibacillus modesticaldus]